MKKYHGILVKKYLSLSFCAGFLALISVNSHALGPVDGEIGAAWWATNFEVDLANFEADVGSVFVYGEGWLGDKWGVRGAWYDSDLEGEALSNQTRINAEIRRKFVSATDDNFFALGAGVESLDLQNGADTEGFRLSAEGRLSIPGPIFLFGRYAWVPDFGDAGNFNDVSATELDLGVHVTPFPFNLPSGY